MQETLHSDFNVILEPLVGTAAPRPVEGEQNTLEAGVFRRAIQELETLRDGLVDPMRGELSNLIASLQSQFNAGGLTPNLASALQEARSNAAQSVAITRANGQAALYDAIDLAAEGAARVNVRLQALRAGDVEAYVDSFMYRYSDRSPEEQVAIRDSNVSALRTPEGQALQRDFLNLPEDMQRSVLERQEKRTQEMRAISNDENQPEYVREFTRQALRFGLDNYPEAADDIIAIRHGRFSEADVTRSYERHSHRLAERIIQRSDDPVYAAQRDAFIRRLSPDVRAMYEASDAGGRSNILASQIQDLLVNPPSREEINREVARSRGDMNAMPARIANYITLESMAAKDNSIHSLRGQVMDAERLMGISQSRREDLSVDDQLLYDSMQIYKDASQPLEVKARAAASMIQSNPRNAAYNTGYAALALAYTHNRPGGDALHGQMIIRARANDPEAVAYMQEFDRFVDRTIGASSISNDPAYVNYMMPQMIEAIGRQINDRDLEMSVDANGTVQFYDRNTMTARNVFMEDRQAHELSVTPQSMLSSMYRAVQAQTERDGPYATIVRDLDNYRLASSVQGQEIIRDLYFDPLNVNFSNVRERLNQVIAHENAGMAEYAPIVLNSTTDAHREVMARYGITSEGGIDIPALMERVNTNKLTYNGQYGNTLSLNNERLRAQNPGLYDARMLSEVATQLRAAHSVEHIADRYNELVDRLSTMQESGTELPANLLREVEMMERISAYRPQNATAAETEQFRADMSNYLGRDTLISEKEASDRYKPESDRANLVQRSTDVVIERLRQDPEFLTRSHEHAAAADSADQHAHNEGEVPHAPVEVPDADAPGQPPVNDGATVGTNAGPAQPAAPGRPETGNSNERLDPRESEGNTGLLDVLHKTDLEKAILSAVSGLTPETRHQMLGGLEAIQAVNTGDLNFISYNEIEKALKKACFHRPDQITDVNGNGLDLEDIRAALTPAVAGQAQGTGRS